MTLYAELDGNRVLTASVVIPRRGAWTADVMLVDAPTSAIEGKVDLTLAGLTLVGTVVRGGSFQGSYRARMVGGAAGWRTVIGRKFYRSPAGLKRGPILKDAAREAGEAIQVSDDATIGQFFVRARAPAVAVLEALYPNWWVDVDGTTKIAARTTPNVATPFELVSFNELLGLYTLATEHPESFAPGARFTSPTTTQAQANLVIHQLTEGKLRTMAYAA